MHGEKVGPEVDLLVLDAQFFSEVITVKLHGIY
jgi:hypothetical protein